jgi:hypothetical protein
MTTEEFLENLLYSATFTEMDKWRRFSAAPEPSEAVMRVFVCMEMRLQHRYGLVELERLVTTMRARRFAREHPGILSAVSIGVALYVMLAKGKHFASPSALN